MSFWFRRKDEEGRVHWYAVEVSLIAVLIGLVLIAVALVSFLRLVH